MNYHLLFEMPPVGIVDAHCLAAMRWSRRCLLSEPLSIRLVVSV